VHSHLFKIACYLTSFKVVLQPMIKKIIIPQVAELLKEEWYTIRVEGANTLLNLGEKGQFHTQTFNLRHLTLCVYLKKDSKNRLRKFYRTSLGYSRMSSGRSGLQV